MSPTFTPVLSFGIDLTTIVFKISGMKLVLRLSTGRNEKIKKNENNVRKRIHFHKHSADTVQSLEEKIIYRSSVDTYNVISVDSSL